MRRIRVIPVLLIQNGGLVKSVKFKDHKYVGDPMNAVKIFNEKEVDEIAVIDISATREKRGPNIRQVSEIASEAFMPMSYGGGITRIEEIKELLYNGIEKVTLNASALERPALITEAARLFGNQSVVASIDVGKNWMGKYRVYGFNGSKNMDLDPAVFARQMEEAGAGEIFLNSIDRDGTYQGYDLALIEKVAHTVSIPVIACGGARHLADMRGAVKHGASAVAAGSLFVFKGPHRAVLINYPGQVELKQAVFAHF